MIPTESNRRILNFPAVHPSESISPATLLTSLINLANRICSYRSHRFTSNKRNARECIRFVSIVLDALEEFGGSGSDLPDAVVLGLSEMHLTFQKMVYLLEDCVREGCRLWMLMKSELVASYFRGLVRSIATALDVMPLDVLDVSVEVKEMVELVMRQARRASFEAEAEDQVAVAQVSSILDRFAAKQVNSIMDQCRSRIDLDESDLGFVIEYLGLEKWSECDIEIKFLNAELGFQNLNLDSADVLLISSLIGLMCYARVLMFDVVDEQVKPMFQTGSGVTEAVLSNLNADDFRCPITLEIMSDPVTVATGQTYDRSSISKWLKSGNSMCPKTGEKLTNLDMVPNHALKKLIRQYCAENGICISEPAASNKGDVKKTVFPGCAAAEGALKRAATYLVVKLSCGRSAERNKAAFEIRLLAKSSIFNRSCLVEAGAIPHLLDLLASVDPATQENAIAALLNLSKFVRSKSVIVEYGGLSLILDVLKMGMKVEAKQHAAAVMFYLSSIDEYRQLIGETPDVIPALVDMIRDGHKRGQKNALIAVFGLLMHPDNRWRVLKAGIVPLLLDFLQSPDTAELSSDCLPVLSILSETPDGTFSILRIGGLKLCAQALNSCISKTAMEYCVSTLLNLCLNGGRDMVGILASDGSLIGSLYSVLGDGTTRASRKASSLIRMLHEFHERSPSSGPRPAPASTMPQDHYFVHAW
uniref:RING-type E3 ubiquitin transferase n=1 Tax=Kalanchoe fedtschenkoi TaxID=63787 RepID=A0A7N0T7T3_KALFE